MRSFQCVITGKAGLFTRKLHQKTHSDADRAMLTDPYEAVTCAWGGWLVRFRGTADELVATGIATADLFEIGKSVQRTTRCEFGDQNIVKRERGKWTLSIRVQPEMQWPSDSTLDPNCKGYQNKSDRKRWLAQGGAEAEAATAAILKRFARP